MNKNIELAMIACNNQNLPFVVERWIKQELLTVIIEDGKITSLGLKEYPTLTYREKALTYQSLVNDSNSLHRNGSTMQKEFAELMIEDFLLQTGFDHEHYSIMNIEQMA